MRIAYIPEGSGVGLISAFPRGDQKTSSPAEDSTIASGHNRAALIRDLLERDSVCLDIVQYLARHSEAADTARGIAEWWIKRDLPSTQDALSKLLERGVVRSHPVQDGTFVYAYTKNTLLRQTLARHVRALTVAPVKGS